MSAAPSQTTPLIERLLEIEERLSRLLVSGWRSAAAEASDLRHLAAGVRAAGGEELADRLDAVAAASGAEDALRAITLATNACRLLRAHLAAGEPVDGRWRAFGDGAGSGPLDRLIPLGMLTIPDAGDGTPMDAWSCLRLRGAFSVDWVLLRPPALAPDWRHRPIQGRLRWVGRFPLGSGEVQLCELAYAAPAPAFPTGQDPLEPFRETLAAGTLEDDAWLLGGGGVLRAREYDPDAISGYVWTNGPAPAWLRDTLRSSQWVLIWAQGDVETIIAAMTDDGDEVHLSPNH